MGTTSDTFIWLHIPTGQHGENLSCRSFEVSVKLGRALQLKQTSIVTVKLMVLTCVHTSKKLNEM